VLTVSGGKNCGDDSFVYVYAGFAGVPVIMFLPYLVFFTVFYVFLCACLKVGQMAWFAPKNGRMM
jgi:hypothetical protein